MIKCEVIEDFNLAKFDELENIKRVNRDERGKLFVGDTFECTEAMANYLLGDNVLQRPFIKLIEVKPIKEAKFEEPKEKANQKNKKIEKKHKK